VGLSLDAALFPHLFDVSARRIDFACDALDHQPTAFGLAAQAAHRHRAVGEEQGCRKLKPDWIEPADARGVRAGARHGSALADFPKEWPADHHFAPTHRNDFDLAAKNRLLQRARRDHCRSCCYGLRHKGAASHFVQSFFASAHLRAPELHRVRIMLDLFI
jgi:hypothetical protein